MSAMNRKTLTAVILCSLVPLCAALAVIYRGVVKMGEAQVIGVLSGEAASRAKAISLELSRSKENLSMLASLLGVGEAAAAGQYAVIEARLGAVLKRNANYAAVCYVDAGGKVRAAAVNSAINRNELPRLAGAVNFKSVWPWQFVDFGVGPVPVVFAPLSAPKSSPAGYVLGVVERGSLEAAFASYAAYYELWRRIKLDYLAAFNSASGYVPFAVSPGFDRSAPSGSEWYSGTRKKDGKLTVFNTYGHAYGVRVYFQLPAGELVTGAAEMGWIFFAFFAFLLLAVGLLVLYITKYSSRSTAALLRKMEEMSKGDFSRIATPGTEGDRYVNYANGLIDRILAYEEAHRKEAQLAALGKLAAQVAHDIRSPLAALGAAAKGLEMPQDQRGLIRAAVDRIRDIADDLLEHYRAPGERPAARQVYNLASIIEPVVAEKKLQYADRTGLKIDFSAPGADPSALVDKKEFQRIISNLLNNAVEAQGAGGAVLLELTAGEGKAFVKVKDNGKGIAPAVLARLGRKGETHGKAGGTGLGLYHASSTLEVWGGSLKITSIPGEGTIVSFELPLSQTAGRSSMKVVLLDDDPLVHMNWQQAAKRAGVELIAFKSPAELDAGMQGVALDVPVYLDFELSAGASGEDIAKDLHDKGFTDITMSTGYGSEKFSHLPWLKVTGKEPPF